MYEYEVHIEVTEIRVWKVEAPTGDAAKRIILENGDNLPFKVLHADNWPVTVYRTKKGVTD